MTKDMLAELWNLFHIARTALADKPFEQQTRYDRMLWASREFHKVHPEISEKTAYLSFERGVMDDSKLGRESSVVNWLMSARTRRKH